MLYSELESQTLFLPFVPRLEAPPPTKKSKSLVDLLLSKSRKSPASQPISATTSLEVRIRRELDLYLTLPSVSSECYVLGWWGSHMAELPLMATLARYVLCVNASSVASERLFSLSGHIVSKRRNSLKPSMVDMLVFLAFNK